MCPDAQETADLLIFTEEINGKFHLFVQCFSFSIYKFTNRLKLKLAVKILSNTRRYMVT